MIQRMLAIVALCTLLAAQALGSGKLEFDPLAVLTASFPNSVEYRNHGKLLEFCPDNTCHGFSASPDVSKATLGDFAFLYVYYYSDYYALAEWRAKEQVKDTAGRVLSKPSYRNCRKKSGKEAARCVLLNLSSQGRIKLLFIRYDEGKRHIVHEDIRERLLDKSPSSQQ